MTRVPEIHRTPGILEFLTTSCHLLNFPGSDVPTSVQAKGAAQGLPKVAVGTTFWFLGSDATLF